MKKLEKQVEFLLEKFPKTRSNDKALIVGVLWLTNKELVDLPFKTVMAMKELPSFESITRARRKVQERNPILCDKTTKEKREKAEEEFRKYYGKKENLEI